MFAIIDILEFSFIVENQSILKKMNLQKFQFLLEHILCLETRSTKIVSTYLD